MLAKTGKKWPTKAHRLAIMPAVRRLMSEAMPDEPTSLNARKAHENGHIPNIGRIDSRPNHLQARSPAGDRRLEGISGSGRDDYGLIPLALKRLP